MSQKFQVNLRGIIDLLSHHLYCSPEVFVRELLQNGVDAITARQSLEPSFAGQIHLELIAGDNDEPATLTFEDNGIGLTSDEAERFLAVIGESSKRGDLGEVRNEFIGQFGIGLLACFVVSEQIVVVSRSARGNEPAIEWKGSSDGTYSVRTLKQDITPGTRIYLRCRPEAGELFTADNLRETARHFGQMLPFPIRFTAEGESQTLNHEPLPIPAKGKDDSEQHRLGLLRYGREVLGGDYFDAIPLRSRTGGIEGVAYVLPRDAGAHPRRDHRVYLKRMFLTDSVEGLLPEWAFFLRCILHVTDLRPTAAREGFHKEAKLSRARDAMGKCIRDYLVDLSKHHPDRLAELITLHHMAIKAVAVHDDELYAAFIDYLPFETTAGTMSLGTYRKQHGGVRFVGTSDEFRQVAQVAAAQSICLINAGYSYDQQLLLKLPEIFPDADVEQVAITQLVTSFKELSFDDQQATFDFVQSARRILAPFECDVELRLFEPVEVASLFTASDEMRFRRSAQRTIKNTDQLWSGMVQNILDAQPPAADAVLCFNYRNTLVRRLTAVKDAEVLGRVVPMLYAQSLMLGRHPLSSEEMKLLNDGILSLVDWGLSSRLQ